jgi:hypothetical protein
MFMKSNVEGKLKNAGRKFAHSNMLNGDIVRANEKGKSFSSSVKNIS